MDLSTLIKCAISDVYLTAFAEGNFLEVSYWLHLIKRYEQSFYEALKKLKTMRSYQHLINSHRVCY